MSAKTILIIDDDTSNIQLVSYLLENSNSQFQILSSTSSTLGLEIALKTIPDVILSDWEMPDLSGLELVSALKSHKSTSNIPIIIITGKNEIDDVSVAFNSGANDFIRKPVTQIELISRIKSVLKNVENNKNLIHNIIEEYKIQIEGQQKIIEHHKNKILEKTKAIENLNRINSDFYENLKSIKYDDCRNTCQVYSIVNEQVNTVLSQNNNHSLNLLHTNKTESSNDEFLKKISEAYPELTNNERKLCNLLRLNLPTKEIANITSRSVRSVEIARTRLREKFKIKGTEIDLHSFLLKF